MNCSRRQMLVWLGTTTVGVMLPTGKSFSKPTKIMSLNMYGLIGKMIAIEGKREQLASILIEGVSGMPGCLSYIVANDATDLNALWITEVWENAEKHKDSLSLTSVKNAITLGRPLIEGFGERFETIPLGGFGI